MVGGCLINIFFGSTRNKDLALLDHFLGFLFTHRTAQQVRTTQRIACTELCRLHHLFLIHHDAIGGFQHTLKQRMQIFKLTAMHTVDKVWNQVHWARTVQGNERDNLFKLARSGFLEHLFHADRFKLKYRSGVCLGKDQIGIFIIQFNIGNVEWGIRLDSFINILNRIFNNGQVTQTQKVKLDQTCCFNVILIVLCHAVGAISITKNCGIISNFTWCDDHTARMLACVTGNTLKLERHFPDFGGIIMIGIGWIGDDILELRLHFNRLF